MHQNPHAGVATPYVRPLQTITTSNHTRLSDEWGRAGECLCIRVLLMVLGVVVGLFVTSGSVKADAPSSNPGDLTIFQNDLYFIARDDSYQVNLWHSDGTSVGTTNLTGSLQANADGFILPSKLIPAGDLLFFFAQRPLDRTDLWVTDGTVSGTRLVQEFSSGALGRIYDRTVAISGKLIFLVNLDTSSSAEDYEVWVSDGTATGTKRLKDTNPNGRDEPRELMVVGDVVYFHANDTTNARRLWKSDGSEAGTSPLFDVEPKWNTWPQSLTEVNGFLYFAASDSFNGAELWRSDGTEAGTEQVANLHPTGGSAPRSLTILGNTLIFTVDDGVHGRELWKTDGATPTMVKDINPNGSAFITDDPWISADGIIYLLADDGTSGLELWRTDGTTSGTQRVADLLPGDGSPFLMGYNAAYITGPTGGLLFTANDGVSGREIWRYDPNTENVTLVRDLAPGVAPGVPFPGGPTAYIPELVGAGENIYFTGTDGLTGVELWQSDGTEAGTTLVRNLRYGTTPQELTVSPSDTTASQASLNSDEHLFFSGYDGAAGREPWFSDGTVKETIRLGDINPGPESSFPSLFTPANGLTFFVADDGTHGFELWVSDGTSTGTRLVRDIVTGADSTPLLGLVAFKDKVLFRADDGTHGFELWISDGTEAGTMMLKDINPGAARSLPTFIAPFDDFALFAADDGVNGTELWRTDGTATGTMMLADIRPGTDSSEPFQFTQVGSHILFAADGTGASGRELWRTNGTAAGTQLVKDEVPGEATFSPTQLTAVGDMLFFVASQQSSGTELWKSDGTEAGTIFVKDIWPGEEDSAPGSLVALGDLLLFSAYTPANGREVWVSDGAGQGTVLLQDLFPGPVDSTVIKRINDALNGEFGRVHELMRVGDRVFFAAETPSTGPELWSTDGTEDGTIPAVDLIPGGGGVSPTPVVNSQVWFSAQDPETNGRELWLHNPTDGATIRLTGPRKMYVPIVIR